MPYRSPQIVCKLILVKSRFGQGVFRTIRQGFSPLFGCGQKIGSQRHVLAKVECERSIGRGEEIVVRQEAFELFQCLCGDDTVDCSRIPVEVGIEPGCHERVHGNGVVGIHFWVESLNAKSMKGGLSVKKNRVPGADFIERFGYELTITDRILPLPQFFHSKREGPVYSCLDSSVAETVFPV